MAEETEKERIDREIIELLNELRVTLPGVQVLFAFLLILPFQQRFATLNDLERDVYLLALMFTTAAIACLVAPASYHRVRFRAPVPDKQQMLFIANRLAIAGVVFLALAMFCALFMIVDVLLGSGWASVFAGTGGLVLALLWFGLPILEKVRSTK